MATDLAGNSTLAALQVVRFSPPAVAITSPAQMSLVTTPVVDVRGTVDPPGGSVTVDGVSAVVAGNTFTAQVPLIEGTNVITAVATTPSGATGTGAVQVFRDSTAPRMAVAFPAAYFFYWGSHLVWVGRRDYGPFYYLPMLAHATLEPMNRITLNVILRTVFGALFGKK